MTALGTFYETIKFKGGSQSMDKKKGSVLIVDDDPFVLNYVTDFLTGRGYSPLAFERTGEALEALKREMIDAVLTDIKMPELSGIELIGRIHALAPDVPVILMTAFADIETAVTAIKAGAFDFIIKPFEPEYLINSVDKAIRYKRLIQMEREYKKRIEDMNAEILKLNGEMEQLAEERTLSLLSLRVADRIRNPVTVIGGFCRQIIKRGVDESVRDLLERVMDECNRLERIVADFDALVREKRVFFKREDLNELVLSTLKPAEARVKEKAVELSVVLSEAPLMFNANRELIKVAINHILNNSIDAAPEGGRVTVQTQARDDSILLSVSDTGKGIPREDMESIFETFYSTKGRTGMGLSLVKQIVSEHLGDINMESEPDRGTTMRISFPVRWKEDATASP